MASIALVFITGGHDREMTAGIWANNDPLSVAPHAFAPRPQPWRVWSELDIRAPEPSPPEAPLHLLPEVHELLSTQLAAAAVASAKLCEQLLLAE